MTEIYFVRQNTDFTKAEEKIINYIIENPGAFIRMSIREVARCIGTSEPTVSRFARHCGYTDFKELKNAVFIHLNEENSPAGKLNSTLDSEDFSTLEGFLRHQQMCLEKTISFLEPDLLEQAVSAILQAKNVYLYAKGPLCPWHSF